LGSRNIPEKIAVSLGKIKIEVLSDENNNFEDIWSDSWGKFV
jgi:hypothetical protein